MVFKYHLRFNENRKFHELVNVNFELSIDAQKIHRKLSRLNWITPEFKENPGEEINMINQMLFYLKKDNRNKMLLTNYTFLSAILDEKLFSPSWAFRDDGTTHPIKGNKYVEKYKKLMIDIIKKNKIQVIYIVGTLKDKNIYDYIHKECFEKILVFKNVMSYEIKDCDEIKN